MRKASEELKDYSGSQLCVSVGVNQISSLFTHFIHPNSQLLWFQSAPNGTITLFSDFLLSLNAPDARNEAFSAVSGRRAPPRGGVLSAQEPPLSASELVTNLHICQRDGLIKHEHSVSVLPPSDPGDPLPGYFHG